MKNGLYIKNYSYKDLNSSQTTTQVSGIQYSKLLGALSGLKYEYTYDSLGNIATVTPSVGDAESYSYDAMGQLTGATLGGTEYVYTYDGAGNITRAQRGTTANSYTYGNSSWVDLLTAYNGQAIAYEGQTVATDGSVSGTPISGNPISYYNGSRWNLSWSEGRNLTSARSTGGNGQYTYDAGGVRTGRTVTKGSTTETHSYIYASGKLLRETITGNGAAKILDFRYDQSGAPYSLTYTVGSTSTVYYYVTNLQGDVMYLVDSSGNQVAAYLYDPFGKVLSSSGTMAEINPLRYRGYYQDSETGFYYLQSRYYDPAICRFINADSYASTGQGLVGYNAFAYCLNNPVNKSDPTGHFGIIGIIAVGTVIGGLLGAFSAATTGGNIIESAIEGALTGALGSACGLLLTPFTAVAAASFGGALIDFSTQLTTQYIEMGSVSLKNVDFKRVAKTGLQTGLGAAIPAIKHSSGAVDSFGTAIVWAEASTLITCTDIAITNTAATVRSRTRSISSRNRKNHRMIQFA